MYGAVRQFTEIQKLFPNDLFKSVHHYGVSFSRTGRDAIQKADCWRLAASKLATAIPVAGLSPDGHAALWAAAEANKENEAKKLPSFPLLASVQNPGACSCAGSLVSSPMP
jgi:hypothetical protein